MSSNLVIVAIPADDDPIWKVSSEKKPHLTICFLGDADTNPNVDRIMLFVEHAVAIAARGPFYLEVDHRDVLGVDKADVYMFREDWSFRWINRFRNQLLQNNDIKAAYESVEQFPKYQPHITLGYPETPAHEDKIPDYGISMVRFDRIGVWTGDFEGPDWRLEWPEQEMFDEAAWGVDMDLERAAAGRYALEHVGVKGMRWGQRKTESITVDGKSKMVTPKKADKAEQKFTQNLHSVNAWVGVHNASAEHFNSRIGAINDRHAKNDYSKEDFDHPERWSKQYKQYNSEVQNLSRQSLEHAVSQLPNSPKGKKVNLIVDPQSDSWGLTTSGVKTVKHASDDVTITVTPTRNSKGLITSVKFEQETTALAQTESFVDDYLVHYGIKGMRWGSQKSSEVTPTSVEVKSTPHNRKTTKVEVKGGSGHDAHPDAIKVAEARQKLRKSGSAALSNSELKNVAERLQLESNVARLEGERKSGSTFVGNMLRKHGTEQLDRGIKRAASQVTDEAATRAGRTATKKIFKAGVAAAL